MCSDVRVVQWDFDRGKITEPFAANATSKVNVLLHEFHSIGVDGAQLCVLKETGVPFNNEDIFPGF